MKKQIISTRLWWVAAAVLALLQSLPARPAEANSNQLMLDEVKRIIDTQGAKNASESGLEVLWGELLDAVATGRPEWLDIAVVLCRHTDSAEAAETLKAALGEALRRDPREVLKRVDRETIQVEGVCGNTFADSGLRGAVDAGTSLAEQQTAVARVEDPELRTKRDACLAAIKNSTWDR